jgi:hypothetical protein
VAEVEIDPDALVRAAPADPAAAPVPFPPLFPFHWIVPPLVSVPEQKMRNPLEMIVTPELIVGDARNQSRFCV